MSFAIEIEWGRPFVKMLPRVCFVVDTGSVRST